MQTDPKYIIEHTFKIWPQYEKEYTSYYQHSLTGNHKDGGNVFGSKEGAKKFESKVKAKRIAAELQKMYPKDKYKVIEY